jgi:hypothetical protein
LAARPATRAAARRFRLTGIIRPRRDRQWQTDEGDELADQYQDGRRRTARLGPAVIDSKQSHASTLAGSVRLLLY